LVLEPGAVEGKGGAVAFHQQPERPGVIGMHQMGQLMDHHVIHHGVRSLDDVPVEHHLSLAVAGAPAGAEGPHAHAGGCDVHLPGEAIGLLPQAFQGTGAIPALEIGADACAALVSLLPGANGGSQDSAGEAHPHGVPLPHLEAVVAAEVGEGFTAYQLPGPIGRQLLQLGHLGADPGALLLQEGGHLQRWLGGRDQPGTLPLEVLPCKAPQFFGRQNIP
jgi:hypothetical protein